MSLGRCGSAYLGRGPQSGMLSHLMERVTLRRPVPSTFITYTSAFPALPCPGVRATVMNFPSGENEWVSHVYVPPKVWVIRWRSVPLGWTTHMLFWRLPSHWDLNEIHRPLGDQSG